MSQHSRGTSGTTWRENEAMTRMILLRLDPLLRMLCDAVQTLKSSRQPQQQFHSDGPDPTANRETYFGLLRTTVELMDELSQQLQRWSSVQREFRTSVADAIFVIQFMHSLRNQLHRLSWNGEVFFREFIPASIVSSGLRCAFPIPVRERSSWYQNVLPSWCGCSNVACGHATQNPYRTRHSHRPQRHCRNCMRSLWHMLQAQ
jgi:hypothetical protein